MEDIKKEKGKEKEQKKRNKPNYESPKVVTYSEDELLKELGPAQACSPFSGAVFGC